MADFACRRNDHCAQRESVRDEVTGDHLGFVGAQIYTADGLCEIDYDKVLDALVRLPLDVAELTTLLAKPVSHALSEKLASVKPGPTLPVREHLHSLRDLIAHETWHWARSLSWELDQPLSSLDAHRSRMGHRVKVSCLVLAKYLPALLELGPTEHPARSLGIRRTDGHDPDFVTRDGDDYKVTRDGLQGAILLLELHEMAWRAAARHTTAVHISFPCRRCGYLALYHELGEPLAQCRHCFHEVTLDHIDILKSSLARSTPAA